MKLGIMQPYFFPYVGYFSLIRATDEWVVFDDVQFIRHGWIERNRVLNSADSWQYIKVPLVKSPRGTKIMDMKIRTEEPWENQIFAQLTPYKKKAPFYNEVLELLTDIFNEKTNDITSLNVRALSGVCDYLGINFKYRIYSSSGIDIAHLVSNPGEWALHISKDLKATEYINPYGGEEIFDKDQYENAGINIRFLRNELVPYNQKRGSFEPGLSILDVLMFNSPEQSLNLIDAYTLT